MAVSIVEVPKDENILAFAESNCSQSKLLPPLRERIDPASTWLKATSGSTLLGVAALSFSDELLNVSEICVAREWRRRGIGGSILDRLIEKARNAGKPRVMVTGIDRREDAARNFLEANGFRMHKDGIRMEWSKCDIPTPEVPAGYEIRTYRNGDEEDWAECINRAYSTTPNPADFMAEKIAKDWVKTPYFMPDGCFFALHEGKIVGAFMAWRQVDVGPRRGRLHWLGIDPAHRRLGLAKVLTVRAMEYLLSHGLDSIYLDTAYAFKPAMEMYSSFGFVETPRLFDYIRDLD